MNEDQLKEELAKANLRIQYLETLLTSFMLRLNDLMKIYVDWRDSGQQSEPQVPRNLN